ncbi:OsmC family protein [Defluviimonas salinarum]|uniref:OsmC family protein n=1 Tax=Defluviimonas salinarum TaxID=2992147 RepID=A0ABT3JAM9_9RHOB|nr:OsmC family protein [Defluviimonas salinarum]MCW3784746.1 OsmC family protein [Defluviimonas salinarum]
MTMMTSETDAKPTPVRDEVIRQAQTAVIERMRQDLAAACNTLVTTGRIEDGLTCHASQGKFHATMDLGPGMGGDAAGPSPGFFARAAIVGCVSIGVKMMAAREGLVFRSVDVTIECDFDDAALMGLSPRTAAPLESRIRIEVDTDEDRAAVRSLVDRALSVDPWYLALRDAQVVQHEIHMAADAGAAPAA